MPLLVQTARLGYIGDDWLDVSLQGNTRREGGGHRGIPKSQRSDRTGVCPGPRVEFNPLPGPPHRHINEHVNASVRQLPPPPGWMLKPLKPPPPRASGDPGQEKELSKRNNS